MTRRTLRMYLLLPVTFTACISLSQAQTGSTSRIEETDKSISYTGSWYTNGSSLNSGGGAALTNAIGATAVVTFTGTGITWIGVLDPWAGMATVYLDGTRNTVDTYGAGTLYQQALFVVRGLANGPHTLSIEVTHMRDANGLGSWVWIDGFDVENGSGVPGGVTATTGRTEQGNPALTYTGVWFPHVSAIHSGGSALLATDTGSRATINFNGTGITWIAYRDQSSGIARVYLDGVLKATIDTYLAQAQAQASAFATNGLISGSHTLTIEVAGTRNPASGGSWIWVDAFDVGAASSNLAQGKTATQSSTYPGSTAGATSAVDGNTNGNFFIGSVTHTNLESNAWWQVDLGASAAIGSIVIWNRTDCCGSRLSDYWVFVSDTPFGPTDTPSGLQNRASTWSSHQTTAPNPSTTIASGGAQGRYLRVQLTGPNNLSLAEVQVLGTGGTVDANLSLGKSATQSSNLSGYATTAAGGAIDGNTDGNFFDGSVTHTNSEPNPWWQVDLGASATVNSILIWNRTDCCGNRLNDYWVFVSDTPFSPADTPFTLQSRAGTWNSHQFGEPAPSSTIAAGGTHGRYVRVQLAGTNNLSLAEVQVIGTAGSSFGSNVARRIAMRPRMRPY